MLLLCKSPAAADYSWNIKGDMPADASYSSVTIIDGVFYSVGGCQGSKDQCLGRLTGSKVITVVSFVSNGNSRTSMYTVPGMLRPVLGTFSTIAAYIPKSVVRGVTASATISGSAGKSIGEDNGAYTAQCQGRGFQTDQPKGGQAETLIPSILVFYGCTIYIPSGDLEVVYRDTSDGIRRYDEDQSETHSKGENTTRRKRRKYIRIKREVLQQFRHVGRISTADLVSDTASTTGKTIPIDNSYITFPRPIANASCILFGHYVYILGGVYLRDTEVSEEEYNSYNGTDRFNDLFTTPKYTIDMVNLVNRDYVNNNNKNNKERSTVLCRTPFLKENVTSIPNHILRKSCHDEQVTSMKNIGVAVSSGGVHFAVPCRKANGSEETFTTVALFSIFPANNYTLIPWAVRPLTLSSESHHSLVIPFPFAYQGLLWITSGDMSAITCVSMADITNNTVTRTSQYTGSDIIGGGGLIAVSYGAGGAGDIDLDLMSFGGLIEYYEEPNNKSNKTNGIIQYANIDNMPNPTVIIADGNEYPFKDMCSAQTSDNAQQTLKEGQVVKIVFGSWPAHSTHHRVRLSTTLDCTELLSGNATNDEVSWHSGTNAVTFKLHAHTLHLYLCLCVGHLEYTPDTPSVDGKPENRSLVFTAANMMCPIRVVPWYEPPSRINYIINIWWVIVTTVVIVIISIVLISIWTLFARRPVSSMSLRDKIAIANIESTNKFIILGKLGAGGNGDLFLVKRAKGWGKGLETGNEEDTMRDDGHMRKDNKGLLAIKHIKLGANQREESLRETDMVTRVLEHHPNVARVVEVLFSERYITMVEDGCNNIYSESLSDSFSLIAGETILDRAIQQKIMQLQQEGISNPNDPRGQWPKHSYINKRALSMCGRGKEGYTLSTGGVHHSSPIAQYNYNSFPSGRLSRQRISHKNIPSGDFYDKIDYRDSQSIINQSFAVYDPNKQHLPQRCTTIVNDELINCSGDNVIGRNTHIDINNSYDCYSQIALDKPLISKNKNNNNNLSKKRVKVQFLCIVMNYYEKGDLSAWLVSCTKAAMSKTPSNTKNTTNTNNTTGIRTVYVNALFLENHMKSVTSLVVKPMHLPLDTPTNGQEESQVTNITHHTHTHGTPPRSQQGPPFVLVEPLIVSIALQVLSVLEQLHSHTPHPVVHSDIKLENILVCDRIAAEYQKGWTSSQSNNGILGSNNVNCQKARARRRSDPREGGTPLKGPVPQTEHTSLLSHINDKPSSSDGSILNIGSPPKANVNNRKTTLPAVSDVYTSLLTQEGLFLPIVVSDMGLAVEVPHRPLPGNPKADGGEDHRDSNNAPMDDIMYNSNATLNAFTFSYVAPECITSGLRNVSPKMDIWGLGCVLYLVAAGKYDGLEERWDNDGIVGNLASINWTPHSRCLQQSSPTSKMTEVVMFEKVLENQELVYADNGEPLVCGYCPQPDMTSYMPTTNVSRPVVTRFVYNLRSELICERGYSMAFCGFLESMLRIDPRERPSAQALLKRIYRAGRLEYRIAPQ